jgi:hypothetical protein
VYKEPVTTHKIYLNFAGCPLDQGGYLQQHVVCWWLFLNGWKTIGSGGIYKCNPSSLKESYHVIVTSYPWSGYLNKYVLNNLYAMKAPDNKTPLVNENEKLWINKIANTFDAIVPIESEIVLHYKNGILEVFLNSKLRATFPVPENEYERVTSIFKKSAFVETIKLK